MNRTIKEMTVKKYYHYNFVALQKHLNTFIAAYNYAKPLTTLDGLTPYEKTLLYLQSNEGKYKINPVYQSMGPNTYQQIGGHVKLS